MTLRLLLSGFAIFTAGVGIGCFWPPSATNPADSAGKSGMPPAASVLSPTDAAFSRIPGMPEPSGLPGDLLHLRGIRDTRVLRSAWLASGNDPDARKVIEDQWTETDPGDVILFLGAEEADGMLRDFEKAMSIARMWEETDPSGILRFLADKPGSVIRIFDNLTALVGGTLQSNPVETLAIWESASQPFQDAIRGNIFKYLFGHDPARALQEIGKLPAAEADSCWSEIEGASDPAGLLRLLGEHPAVACPDGAYAQLLQKMAETDPSSACGLATRLPSGPRRRRACEAVVAALIAKNPEEALAWLEAHAPSNTNRAAVGAALLPTDPARALSLMAGGEETYRDELREQIQALAKSDWTAARELTASAPTPPLRQTLMRGMANTLIFGGTQFFPNLEKVSRLITEEGYRPDYLSLEDSPRSETAAAMAGWLKNQPPAVHEQLLPTVSSNLELEGSDTAAQWLSAQPESSARTTALASTVSRWAASDPQAAANFSLTLPPGTDHDFAILNTALAWSRTQSAEARQWVQALPDTPAKTRALQELQRN